jgi:hypothetical protein
MDKGHKNSQMEIFIKDNTQKESPMAMENTIGQMVVISKEILEMG